MERLVRKVLLKYCYGVCIFFLCIFCQTAIAGNYPGNNPPYQLSSNETFNVNSGTMQTTSSVTYTLDLSLAITNGSVNTINVLPGAILGYSGSSNGGAATYFAASTTNTITNNINNSGTIQSTTGVYAIYLNNGIASPSVPADTYNVTFNSGSLTAGAILTNGIHKIQLTLNGTANITGTIDLNANGGVSTSNSIFIVQGGANFTLSNGLSNIGLLNITGSSTMTIGQVNSNINSINIDPGSTLNITTALNGLSVSDGSITNNGTMNISANIAKTGTFTGGGTVNVSEPVSFATNGYTITNHNIILTDILNYGEVTMSTSGKSMTATNITFTDNNGYFPGGTLTLASASGGGTINYTNFTKPSNTLFLSFGTQSASGGSSLTIPITRTPFNVVATTPLTQEIGATLESLGGTNPNTAMLSLLDGVEASTTQAALESSLEQLAPLISAPVYCFEVQTSSLKQVELRLADIRTGLQTGYLAGEIGSDNHIWLRPFGAFANQLAKDDTLGYYATSGGLGFGFDRNLGAQYTLGAAFVYALSHVKDKVNQISNTQIKSYIGMAYGTYNFSDVAYLDWIFGVTANNFVGTRIINLNGIFSATAMSTYGSQQVTAQLIWGKAYAMFGWLQATPEASVQYTFAKQYAYTETGAGAADLTISKPNSDILQLGLGTKLAVPVYLNPGIMVPEIHGTALYYPITGKQNTLFNFVEGGGPMVSLFNMSRTGLEIGCALTIAVIDKLEVKFEFDYEIQDRFSGHAMYLDLRYVL